MLTPSELQHRGAENAVGNYFPAGPRVEKVRKLFSRLEGRKKILDVGCANGSILSPFAKTHEIHGVEISEGFTAEAIKNGVLAKVHDLETEPLPYPDKTFDVLFSGENIEHIFDTDWVLAEMNRVMKPGGIFVLTFPNIRTVLSLVMMAFFDMTPMYAARYRSGHWRDFTVRTIKLALGNHGFVVNKCIGCSFYLPKIGEFGSWLATCLPSWANTTIVVSTKERDSVYEEGKCVEEIY
jgi:SAM-dependent methyltransferase